MVMFNTAANTEIFENYFPDPVERGRFISVTADVISIICSHLSVTVWKSLNYAKTTLSCLISTRWFHIPVFFIHFLYSITLKRTQSFEVVKKIKASLCWASKYTEKKSAFNLDPSCRNYAVIVLIPVMALIPYMVYFWS